MKGFFLVLLIFVVSGVTAQDVKERKIVFQVTSSDSLVHKGVMKQIDNILKSAPHTKLEVVCHGPGLSILVQQQSAVSGLIANAIARNVVFVACENTMKEKKVTINELLPNVKIVEAGILYIVDKMEEGYHYIKAGF